MKEFIGAIAVILTFAGYIPYIKDTLKGKTRPHIYSWFIWSLVTTIAFALQVSDKAGPGSLVTLSAAIVCFLIFLLGFRQGNKDITRLDTLFFILSLVSIFIWLFAKQPIISVILVSSVDMFSFLPTIRKSWNKPRTETLSSYIINTFRFALAIIALNRYTLVSSLYPITWVLANGFFSVFLIVRRRSVKN